MDGQRLNALAIGDLQYFETRFFLVPGTGTVYVDAKLSVIRRRAVRDGFHEWLTILNHDDEPVELTVRIEAGRTSPTCSRSRMRSRRRAATAVGSKTAGCCSPTSARRTDAQP